MTRFVSAVAVLATAAALTAQVPYGSSVVGVIGNLAPSEGLFMADRAGVATPVTGLLAAGSSNLNVNAVALDPIDDRVWITSSTTNQLNWIRILGSTVSQFTQHGTITVNSLASITFDDNANPLVCGGTALAGVFRIDRKLGGAGTIIGAVATGTHNGITKDGAGNLYIGMFGTGQVHMMVKNPNGTYQPPVLHGTTAITSISGIAFAPTDGVNPDELWITTFGAAGNQLFRMPITGGAGVPVANTLAGCNWVDYDRSRNDILIASQAGNDRVFQVNRTTGLDTTLCTLGSGSVGVPASNDANDAPWAGTTVAPMILNGGVGPFDLEVGTTAPPGTLALIGTAFPSVVVLGVALVGADGKLSVNLPNVTLGGPIAPGSLQFIAAYFDVFGNLNIGAPVSWPAL